MIATARYQLALLLRSQRYLPPAVAFFALLAVLYGSRNAPAPPELAVSAGALTVVACWLTVALADIEDPVQRLITVSHARARLTVVAGLALTVLACTLLLGAVSLAWALLVHGGMPAGELGWGVLAHLACASAGAAIGLPCSRLLVPRIGYTLIAALLALAAVLLVRWVPLVNPMLRGLTNSNEAAGPAAAVLAGLAASAIALVLSVTAVAAARRS